MRTLGFVDTIPSQGSSDAIEEIIGPVCGYWLACYTHEAEEGYFAYAKLCLVKPEHVWDAVAQRKMAAGPYRSPEAAISAVVDFATVKLSQRREEREGLIHSWKDTQPGEEGG